MQSVTVLSVKVQCSVVDTVQAGRIRIHLKWPETEREFKQFVCYRNFSNITLLDENETHDTNITLHWSNLTEIAKGQVHGI